MPERIDTAILDLMLDACEGDELFVCTTEPGSYLAASTTLNIATATVGPGDWSRGAGSPNGRAKILATIPDIPIDFDGLAQHVVLCAGSNTIKRVMTCQDLLLTAANNSTVDIGGHSHHLNTPT